MRAAPRRGPLVALVGPDGSGKSSVAKALLEDLRGRGVPAASLYMGVSAASADRLLPTSRLARRWKQRWGAPADDRGPRLAEEVAATSARRRGVRQQVRAVLRLVNRIAEEAQREATMRRRTRRGETVVVDRHFALDYHATDVTRRDLPWDRRAHGWFLRRALRRPDLVVHLHAPAEVLHARKGEGSVAVLAARQVEYDALAGFVPRYETVDASGTVEATLRRVATLVDAVRREPEPVAIVTDADRGSAVAIIRSLRAAGWRVVAADTDRRATGLHARATGATLVHADPASEPELVGVQLADAAARHGASLVFPVTDRLVRICRAAPLPASTAVAAAEPAAYATVSDKWWTVEAARRLGVPVPPSTLVRPGDDLAAELRRAGLPAVVKPRWSVTEDDGRFRRHDVALVAGPDDAERLAAPRAVDVVVQGFHPGNGVGVELLTRDGELLAAFQHRRIREHPLAGGASSLRVGEALDPDLLRWSLALLADVRWTGLAMVEFKVGPAGPALMEINGRVWGSLPLAVRSGVDFPALAAALHTGRPVPATPPGYEPGRRSRNLRLELLWAAAVLARRPVAPGAARPRRRDAARVLACLPLPGDGHDVLTAADPGATLAELAQAARLLATKARTS